MVIEIDNNMLVSIGVLVFLVLYMGIYIIIEVSEIILDRKDKKRRKLLCERYKENQFHFPIMEAQGKSNVIEGRRKEENYPYKYE